MSKYFVDGQEYETPLKGLVITNDTDKKNVLCLNPTDNEWKRFFEADPYWVDPEFKRAIFLYAYENNLSEVEHVAYVTWKDVQNSNGEREIQLDSEDRAYLNGLLTQRFLEYDSVEMY
ncbi:MAG: hypothetical protein J5778_04455 [Clostridiales bacterium]|nr:hypothetical protein [Clostridiales bacterium]